MAAGDAKGPIKGDQDSVRLQEGYLWESALEYVAGGLSVDEAFDLAFRRLMVTVRQGIAKQVCISRDGIRMTPDGFNASKGEIESYKHTRRSLRNAKDQSEFESNFWTWMVQEKSYAYALGVDTCTWIVLWAAGDYSMGAGSSPKVLQSTGVWTADELAENWRVVMKHAEGLR